MRRGDLFVLSWESLRRVEWGKVSSFLSMSGGGLFNSLSGDTHHDHGKRSMLSI